MRVGPGKTRIKIAVALTVVILVAEVIGGYLSNSLALFSDAGHVFTDFMALLLAWFGISQMERPSTERMTYGYHRVGIITALVNAITLAAIAGVIIYEALRRLQSPPPVDAQIMLPVALFGLLVNGFVALMLFSHRGHSLNMRSALWHVFGDILGSIGVIVSALSVWRFGWSWMDPVASLAIGGIIAVGSWRILKEGTSIILEASPAHLDMEEVVQAIKGVPGIRDVHDLHIWTIAPNIHALSCHIEMDDVLVSEGIEVLREMNGMLAERFNIGHSTVQMECPGCDPNDLYCYIGDDTIRRGESAVAHKGR